MTVAGQLHALLACAENPRASNAEIAWYRAHLPQTAGTLLELMCGNGRLLAPLIEAGMSVHGVDASAAMLADKCDAIVASGADTCTAVDGSCLLQIGGGLRRRGAKVRALHLAEILAAT